MANPRASGNLTVGECRAVVQILGETFASTRQDAAPAALRLVKPVTITRHPRGTAGAWHCCPRCEVEWCATVPGDDRCFHDRRHRGHVGNLAEFCPHGVDAGGGIFGAVCAPCRDRDGGVMVPAWLWEAVQARLVRDEPEPLLGDAGDLSALTRFTLAEVSGMVGALIPRRADPTGEGLERTALPRAAFTPPSLAT